MKKLVLPVIIFSFFITSLYAQNYPVTFKVISHLQNKNDSVFISGNHKKFGIWSPGATPLQKFNDSTWSKTIYFPENTILEYKFTKGTWQSEALNNDGSIPHNSVLKVMRDTTVVKRITKWKDQNISKSAFKGKVTGQVKYFRNVKGEGIKPRDVAVWLPPGYDEDTLKHYPVLYMQDGQNIFDPKTSSFGVDWQADETADSLINNKIISPAIIVGIYNTSDRSLEYTPTKKGMAYMKFVVTKLKPFIDKTFRTLPGRDFTVVGGSSYGGTISFMLLWYYSNVFSKAACFSPAFSTDRFDLTKIIKNYHGIKKDIKLYIDIGGVGLEQKLLPGIDEMINSLKGKGFKLNEDYFFYQDSTARHFEADWAKRFWRPLEIFFGESMKNLRLKESHDLRLNRLKLLIKSFIVPDKPIGGIAPLFNINYHFSVLGFSKKNQTPYFFLSFNSALFTIFTSDFLFNASLGPEVMLTPNIYIRLAAGGIFASTMVEIRSITSAEIGILTFISGHFGFEANAGIYSALIKPDQVVPYFSIGILF